jgi:hypothetical protein
MLPTPEDIKDDPGPNPDKEKKSKTTVSVGAAFLINGNTVTVNSGDITKIKEDGLKFELAAPVDVGTPKDVVDWFIKTFSGGSDGTFDLEAIINTIPAEGFPGKIRDALLKILNANVTVQALNVDTKAGLFEIVILASFENLKILDLLEIKSLGFGLKREPTPVKEPDESQYLIET